MFLYAEMPVNENFVKKEKLTHRIECVMRDPPLHLTLALVVSTI
jgi:hypothetical protein